MNQFVYTSLLENDYNTASTALTQTNEQLDKEFNVNTAKDYDIKEMFDVKQKLQMLNSVIDKASRQIIALSTVFVLSSIILPLFFIWTFILCIKFAITGKIETETILQLKSKKS